MSTDTFSTLAAVATMLAIAIAVVAIVAIARPATGLGAPGRLVRGRPLEVGGAVATASMLGSLYYSQVADFVPCDYCWYQRIAMYPLAFILVIGAIRRDRGAMYTALPLAAIGLGIAIYHYQLQLFPEQSSSCNLFAPCTQQWVDTWGFISIPFMAGAGFLAIASLAVLTVRDDRRRARSEHDLTSADGAGETAPHDDERAVVPEGSQAR